MPGCEPRPDRLGSCFTFHDTAPSFYGFGSCFKGQEHKISHLFRSSVPKFQVWHQILGLRESLQGEGYDLRLFPACLPQLWAKLD